MSHKTNAHTHRPTVGTVTPYTHGAAQSEPHTYSRDIQPHLQTEVRAWSVAMTHPPQGQTITPLHGAPHSHIRSQSHTWNPVPLVPSPSPRNSHAPETPDPLRPPLQAAPPQPTDAPAQPGRTPKT